MEISDYLYLIRRRIRLFVAVPLLAVALVAASMLLNHKERYVSNVTVSVSSFSGVAGSQFSGAQGNRVLLETFAAAAGTPTVLGRVSQATGVPIGDLQAEQAVAVAPIGDSSLIRVTARHPDGAKAAEMARAVSVESMKFILEPQVQLSGKLAEQAQQTVAQTEGQLSELSRSSGLALGIPEYEAKTRAISAMREELLRARAAGDTRLATSLEGAINTQTAELAILAPKLAQFQTLSELNKQALERVNVARSTQEQAKALQASAEAGDLITTGDTNKITLGPLLLRRALGALGAGVFLAALIVVLLEFLSRGERSERSRKEKARLVEEPELS